MDTYLTGERADPPPNRRNGTTRKTVTTDSGEVVLDISRLSREAVSPVGGIVVEL
ncbi:hypothetical protein [Palleronia caenipelagi]|uniref:hypothetical protein n=1 Tax=Palleronia caenipelagi TaxID=2489174 RepID=UPI00163DC4CC|nr:hypothetical protein [Palleronia caenipelagi]